jgi:hypothetical protein
VDGVENTIRTKQENKTPHPTNHKTYTRKQTTTPKPINHSSNKPTTSKKMWRKEEKWSLGEWEESVRDTG